MRKVASIQTINSLVPIELPDGGVADNVVLATFENIAWQCVVKKDDFNVGDLCVYFEISTQLPTDNPAFDFVKKGLVKTRRFLGVLSQGLAMPISILPDGEYADGNDVSGLIGAKPWEPVAENARLGGEQEGIFPLHIVAKTDQERIQSMPWILQAMKDTELEICATEKIDGTSSTFYFEDGELKVCSRNFIQRRDNGSIYWKIAEQYKLETILKNNPELVLQGEIAGPGIQGNPLGLNVHELFLFDVFNREHNTYYGPSVVRGFANWFGTNSAQILYVWNPNEFAKLTIEDLLNLADGKYNSGKPREGIVIRPKNVSVWSVGLGRYLSFKVISNDFLLKGGN